MRLVDLVLVLLRLAIGCWLLWRLPRLPGGGPRLGVSVVIPARNEAAVLPAALASITTQMRDGDELLVVDDHSADGTAAIAEVNGATVVQAPSLADGWTGKTWACWTGAGHATNPVVAFLDADTQLEPGGLDRLVTTQTEAGGMVSAYPYHDVPRPHEKLNALFNVVAAMGADAFTPFGDRRAANAAFGPVILVGSDDYISLDGHRAVAGEVLDDMKIAQVWSGAGKPVRLFNGRGTCRFRMYPGGLGDVVDGWTKNFAAGAGAARLSTVVMISLWITLLVQAAWMPVGALTGLSGADHGTAAALYASVAIQLWWMQRRIGSFGPVTAVLFPLTLALFIAVFARSLVLTAMGRPVRWKGRMVSTSSSPVESGPD